MWLKLLHSESDSERNDDYAPMGLGRKIKVYSIIIVSILTGVAAMILGLRDAVKKLIEN